MDEKDLMVDIFTNATSNVAIKITHRPTGLFVTGEGLGQWRLRKRLINELEQKVNSEKET